MITGILPPYWLQNYPPPGATLQGPVGGRQPAMANHPRPALRTSDDDASLAERQLIGHSKG